jgi:hypothetical protein
MKKEKAVEEVVQEAPQEESSVRSYFTQEINNQMSEMSMKEMETLLKEIISSREWIAILKYINTRSILLDSQLRSTNPTVDPHIISWSQGALSGLYDIENYVIDLNSEKPEEKEEENINRGPEGIV